MKLSSKSLGIIASAALAAITAAPAARGAVSLSISDGDATPTSRVVTPGSTFTVTVSLLSTAEKLTGVDYYLQSTGAGAGKFRITDRNVGSSPFSDLLKADTGDNNLTLGVEDSTVSLLNPRNGLDLGASINNVNAPLDPGAYTLASYTFSVPANLAPGTYLISTTSDAGTGYVGAAPLFPESGFNQQGTFTVTVNAPTNPIPEPAGGMVLFAACGFVARRRRA
jgi:hypothetical protein